MPALSMSTYCSVWASKPKVSDLFSVILPTTIEPSTPAFSTIWRIGASSALSTMLMPAWTSAFSSLSLRTADLARKSATPPPGTMPSSTAAFVACIASSTRSFFSLTSTSVEPPTRMTATPPASFARRHCQSKIYTACSRINADWSSTVFAHELTTRSAGFDAENRLYLFALTMPPRRGVSQLGLHPVEEPDPSGVAVPRPGRDGGGRRRRRPQGARLRAGAGEIARGGRYARSWGGGAPEEEQRRCRHGARNPARPGRDRVERRPGRRLDHRSQDDHRRHGLAPAARSGLRHRRKGGPVLDRSAVARGSAGVHGDPRRRRRRLRVRLRHERFRRAGDAPGGGPAHLARRGSRGRRGAGGEPAPVGDRRAHEYPRAWPAR